MVKVEMVNLGSFLNETKFSETISSSLKVVKILNSLLPEKCINCFLKRAQTIR